MFMLIIEKLNWITAKNTISITINIKDESPKPLKIYFIILEYISVMPLW